jgi:3-deoxy-7-phosphoheptulonate synthase
MAATIQELLLAAEYVLAAGNPNVILCERGVRGFDAATRNIFDVSAVPLVHKLSHLPIVADPSHGVGVREHVSAMARAAVAAGADGLISDGAQSLYPEQFAKLMGEVGTIAHAIGRRVPTAADGAAARGNGAHPAGTAAAAAV